MYRHRRSVVACRAVNRCLGHLYSFRQCFDNGCLLFDVVLLLKVPDASGRYTEIFTGVPREYGGEDIDGEVRSLRMGM